MAVKVLPFDVAGGSGARMMRKEVAVLRKVSYDPHVVQFFGASADNSMLVMEYMEVRMFLSCP